VKIMAAFIIIFLCQVGAQRTIVLKEKLEAEAASSKYDCAYLMITRTYHCLQLIQLVLWLV
jgi:hypothetical protein